MKKSLQAGIAHEFAFRITDAKTVPALYPEAEEFQQMPRVLATGYMVGLLEWACVQAVNPHLEWPDEQTVGVHIDVSHEAATPPGLIVSVRTELVKVDGRRLIFDVQARDGIDLITRGRHERFVITRSRFIRKMEAKGRQAALI